METNDDAPTGEEIRSIVARCIEALDVGEEDPASRLCSGRASLEAAVREKLQKLRELQLLETPRADAAEPSVPETIGPYRIVKEIGRGGMGQVFLAEQTSPVERDVALKLIGRGLDSDAIVSRFRAEQQTLARMGHPSIAQVHDAGTAPDGRPFFVMEFVDGVPFDVYCRDLPLEERLHLFVEVCLAVQHAHDRGVIHRDLKPSNVLVTRDGTPKVIDFGIAKALDRGEDDVPLTRHDEILGTPEYMSPEQARSGQLEVDVRSDVYSLGVMLYALVAGELPFPSRILRAAGIREMERIITETTPVAPSVRRAGAARGATSRELDWITLKALEKEPGQRYPSVRDLSSDVERFLADVPVEAGPPSVWYRVRKLARRHRVSMSAAAAVLVAVIGGTLASQHFAALAGDRARETDVARDDLGASVVIALEVVEDSLLRATAQDELDEVPAELIQETQRLVETLDPSHPRPRALSQRLASSLARVSMLYSELGRPDEARAAAERALEVNGALEPRNDVERASRLKVQGMARSSLADALEASGDAAGARAAFARAVEDLRAAREISDDVEARGALERSLVALAVSVAVDDSDRALEAMAEAMELGALVEATPERAVEAANYRARLGVIYLERGELIAAQRELELAVADLEANIFVPNARRCSAYALDRLSRVLVRRGRHREAEIALERCVERRRRLLALHEASPVRRYGLATALMSLSGARLSLPDVEGAIEAQGEAVELLDLAIEQSPNDVEYRSDHGRALYGLARCLMTRGAPGDGENARELMARSVEVARDVCDLAPEDLETRFFFATTTLGLAASVFGAGDTEGGLLLQDEAIDALAEIVETAPSWASARYGLAAGIKNRIAMMYAVGEMLETGDLAREGLATVMSGLESSPDDHRLLTMRVEFRAHIAALELGESEDIGAACAAAESWVEEWPDGIPAHVEAAGMIAICADTMPDGDDREMRFAQALDHVAAALDLGFEPPPGWPEPGGGVDLLAGREDFQSLVERD